MRQLPKNRLKFKIILPLTSTVKTAVLYDFESLKNEFPNEFKTLDEIESIINSPCFSELIKSSNNEFTMEASCKYWVDNTGLLFREESVKDILTMLNSNKNLCFSPDCLICDLLAKNSYVNQAANRILEPNNRPGFINSEISFMFKKCLKKGMFSVWQSAENPFQLKGWPHFSKPDMLDLVKSAGLNDDPFTIVDDSEKKAISKLGEYIIIQLCGLTTDLFFSHGSELCLVLFLAMIGVLVDIRGFYWGVIFLVINVLGQLF